MQNKQLGLESGFGDRLKSERTRLRLTQDDLARKVNKKPLAILKYEKNMSVPSLKTLYALQKSGMNLGYLILGSEYKEENYSISSRLSEESLQLANIGVEQINTLFRDTGGLSETNKTRLILILLSQFEK